MINLWPLLLPAAAYSGWWIARKSVVVAKQGQSSKLSREYVVGLNYLLNEQPDKAVDIFIKLLEVDSDTVETHLALGSLFRRRGEVDRAIRIHQNLIARPQLSDEQRVEALIALGQDYLSAGVYDRAERIFIEAAGMGGEKRKASLQGLLAIYENEKAWEQAIDTILKLEIDLGISMHVQAANYYCELAMLMMSQPMLDKAKYYIKQALAMDKSSVRANLLLAEMEIKYTRFKSAIKILKRIPELDPDFIPEIVAPLVDCYEKTNSLDECVAYFRGLMEFYPRSTVIFVVAEYMLSTLGVEQAADFVAEQLKRHPSIRGLNRLISWHVDTAHGKVRDKLSMLYGITSKFLKNKPVYRCGSCGFGGKILHWQCPSCKQWSKMKPIHGLEGD